MMVVPEKRRAKPRPEPGKVIPILLYIIFVLCASDHLKGISNLGGSAGAE